MRKWIVLFTDGDNHCGLRLSESDTSRAAWWESTPEMSAEEKLAFMAECADVEFGPYPPFDEPPHE